MRGKLVLGLGLAGMLAGPAAAQFGSPPAPAPFGGTQPAMPPGAGGYVPPVGGFQPASPTMPPPGGFRPAGPAAPAAPAPIDPNDIPTALPLNHPLLVKPEDGAYLICVKSYSRPHNPDPSDPGFTVRQLAEGLANDIQQSQRCRVMLFELISDEKKTQAQAKAEARQKAAAFAASLEVYRQKSQIQGMDFLGADVKLKYQTFNYRDQVAVLVGGYPTEDAAVKALAAVKKWPAPRDERLMDGGAIVTPGADGKSTIEKSRLNPYPQAMIFQNPSIPKQAAAAPTGMDPFVVRLNEDRPYNLLKATKPWTLGVKTFSAPVTFASKDSEPSAMQRMGMSKGADVLRAGAEQAEALAKALREMRGPANQPLMLEAFVLHTRSGSIVTVGQFDGPNDPALLEQQRILTRLTFNLSRDDKGRQITGTGQNLFGDTILAVPIPRH